MKPKAKVLVLMLALMLPYMGFVLYRVFTYPQHSFPSWFFYVAPCYFFGSIALLMVLRKKIVGDTPPQDFEKRRRSAARAARLLGYIFLLGPVAYLLTGGLLIKPTWETALGFSWACFLSWACFRVAKKNEVESRQSAT